MPEVSVLSIIEGELNQLREARTKLRGHEEYLKQAFVELLYPHLKPGTIVDTRKPGPAYAAGVVQGRAYGHFFQIMGNIGVKVDTARPSLSRWSVQAVSIKDPVTPEKILGKPFYLSGRVVPGPRPEDPRSEEEIVLAGMKWLRANA